METLTKQSPIRTVNPFTNQVVSEFDVMRRTQVNSIVEKAYKAFALWRKTSFEHRSYLLHKVASIMRKRKIELGKLATLEMGKLLKESVYEVELSADIFDYYARNGAEFLADQPLKITSGSAFLSYEPIGVLLSIQPWNFPFYQVARSAAPNIMAGNTILLKHASNVPQCAMIMEEIFLEAGVPAGVYNNLLIPGSSIEPLIRDKRIAAVALTGSEPAGASVAAAAGAKVKKTTLELGGSDPFIVLADADIDKAVHTAVYGRMWNAGQVCVSPKRVIVPGSIYYEFLAKTKNLFRMLKTGDPMDSNTDVAPLSSERAAKAVIKQIRRAVEQGATVLMGGNRVDHPGAFVEPTLITGVTSEMDAYREEIFGPVFVLYTYRTIDEAIEIANATEFGLGGSVFGTNIEKAIEVARRIESGMVYINHVTGIAPELPFGGTKHSGYGREQSPAGIYEFVNPKLIRVTTPESNY
ncbi:NAD-dependent succinate-semialdehyde dehydrogenase [Flavihumibacter solisilvae]|uniref:Succinate-semialdehyde dehydrogenase n=1 Tax=Flavihumibacter solisilvae TaxID=1349421 RepID=A0A0C1L1W5_9BACT|nr:NAD-dependent succinate-semialdehyde dehydrogenase [Flavihumibacter solisilvae]KIC93581.1 succinate-semialdehyde dehydrogenase [Flavihumibacter solisilvae]